MNGAKETAISIVKDYLEDVEVWYGYCPEHTSYLRWAANEILQLVQDSDEPPLTVIEAFAEKMETYSHVNEKTSFIFETAHNVAQDIIDLLTSY